MQIQGEENCGYCPENRPRHTLSRTHLRFVNSAKIGKIEGIGLGRVRLTQKTLDKPLIPLNTYDQNPKYPYLKKLPNYTF